MIDVRPVDPRDAGGEQSAPQFRVFFFDVHGPKADTFASQEHDVTGADVRDVLAWVAEHRPPRAASAVALKVPGSGPHEAGLVLHWLVGYDLNGEPVDEYQVRARRRMLVEAGFDG